MHSPQLINEILDLKLKLDFCEPSETADIQREIVSKMEQIQLLSKVPWNRIKAVVNSRYPEFVKEQIESGRIRVGVFGQLVLVPKAKPEEPSLS